MHDFKYKNSELYAEGVPVRKIAEKAGTPVYIYSHKTLLRHFNAYRNAFDGHPHIICFALKANSNPAVLRTIAKNGGGADVVSGGELYLAHSHTGLDIEIKFGVETLKQIYKVWKRPVHLHARIDDDPILFSFDGEQSTQQHIDEAVPAPANEF